MLIHNPHAVVITETWLRDDIDDETVFPRSYQVFRRDRATRGGGVAVLVNQNTEAHTLQQIANHESVTLKLSYGGRSFVLFAVYRPPDSPPQYLCDLADHMSKFRRDKIYLVGDFNLPNIDWNSPFPSTNNDINASYMCDIMLIHNLQQGVKHPTRIHGEAASILDLVFLSQATERFTVSVETGLSDHCMVVFTCPIQQNVDSEPAKIISVKNFSRANDESVLDYFSLHLDMFRGTNVDELWNKFKEICTCCIDNYIPNRTKKTCKKNSLDHARNNTFEKKNQTSEAWGCLSKYS